MQAQKVLFVYGICILSGICIVPLIVLIHSEAASLVSIK